MKAKIYLSVLIFELFFTLKAQVVLYEDFSSPFNPAANGWDVQNLSSPVGSNSWFQGTNAFNALAGGPADYFGVNFNSTSGSGVNNTISNWLITPTLNLVNGAVVQFATRTTEPASGFADRLQLYYSTAGNGTDVGLTAGTATNTAGTFTNMVLDINATQAAMGYPSFWVVLTATLNGIATPTVGRLAFRYYLTNAGAAGINGNFVGIDEFRYSLPCLHAPAVAAWNGALCSGNSVTLSVMGAITSITSYTWMTGANTSTTAFVPANSGLNSVYVLWETTPGCHYLEVANLNVLPAPTVSVTVAPTGNVCPGSAVTLSASGADSYTYTLNAANTISSTINPYTYTATAPAGVKSFTLKGTSTQGCKSAPVTLTLMVNTCTGIDDVSNSFTTISVYPNPFNEQLFLKGFTGQVQIYDVLGSLVLETTIRESEVINTQPLPSGVYILKTRNGAIEQRSVHLLKN